MRQELEIVRAVCCDNLSDIEAAMVFKCSVDSIHQAVANVMRETGTARGELWKLFGTPNIGEIPEEKFMNYPNGFRATFYLKCEKANNRIRANPYR